MPWFIENIDANQLIPIVLAVWILGSITAGGLWVWWMMRKPRSTEQRRPWWNATTATTLYPFIGYEFSPGPQMRTTHEFNLPTPFTAGGWGIEVDPPTWGFPGTRGFRLPYRGADQMGLLEAESAGRRP